MYLQLINFLKTISFWFVECLFLIDGTLTLANYFQSHYGKLSHYGKFTALHKLISIVLQFTNQIRQKFPAKSCGAGAIF